MNPIPQPSQTAAADDCALVARCLAGDRGAFAQIVARHQSLVCSVTYSVTGRLALSEELAQETFLVAWRQLPDLREPQRLRAWLAGIARHLAQDAMRRGVHEAASLPLDAANDVPAPDARVDERAERTQQEDMIWRALDRMPERYREPLVLFYREQHSIERVAQALDISIDNAKQRLSRGRKMLHDEVAAVVEGALAHSAPGKAFTAAVIAALPGMAITPGAQAATLGTAGAATGGVWGSLAKFSGALIGSVAAMLGIQVELALARDDGERALVRRESARMILGTVLFVLALWTLLLSASTWRAVPAVGVGLGAVLACAFAAWYVRTMLRGMRARRALVTTSATRHEYCSAIGLFGLPWVHVRWRTPDLGAKPVRAWIAVGDRAVGGLFALGTVAIAPIALGATAVGIVAVGGVSYGLMAVAGAAFGAYAFGGTAIGVFAVGGYALGGIAAAGHVAIAAHYALGISAFAPDANSAAAAAFLFGPWPARLWLIACLSLLLSFVPTLWYLRRLRKHAT